MPALEAGRFVSPFNMGRMTWIKPSFNWMMYRSGYAAKPGQEIVLGVDITREGFEWALKHAVLSRFNPSLHTSYEERRRRLAESAVRVQWDPERDCRLNIIDGVRTIQIGLSGEAVSRYVSEWIVRIEDMTNVARQLAADLELGETPENLPSELEAVYPLDTDLRCKLFWG
jgi:hypothetical protein